MEDLIMSLVSAVVACLLPSRARRRWDAEQLAARLVPYTTGARLERVRRRYA